MSHTISTTTSCAGLLGTFVLLLTLLQWSKITAIPVDVVVVAAVGEDEDEEEAAVEAVVVEAAMVVRKLGIQLRLDYSLYLV